MLITKVNVDNNGLSGVSFEDFAPDLYVVDNTVKMVCFWDFGLKWSIQGRIYRFGKGFTRRSGEGSPQATNDLV